MIGEWHGGHRATAARGKRDGSSGLQYGTLGMIEQCEEPFNLPLLQAINDWQRGGDAKQARKRGQSLKRVCGQLPDEFRQCSLVCHRQIALTKSSVWELTAEEQLGEKISAWTLDIEIAKRFKGGVPPEGQGYQGIIFSRFPEQSEVIANLHRLYREVKFQLAVDTLRSRIDGFGDGIGKYGDSQCEVVVETKELTTLDIYSFGGHSSQFDELVLATAKLIFGPTPTIQQLNSFRLNAEQARGAAGPNWLSPEATNRVLNRMTPHVELLKMVKKIQETIKG